ncbi:MAG: nuclear transport factor 2 family protein [Caulobacteraceae bacterium]|nr:nuclear transport factor 2 family protein [Caulobacteraceae bacterium]
MEALCDLEALLQAHNDAWNRHDVAAFVETLSPDAEIYAFPGTLQLKGREPIAAHFTQLWAKVPELSVTVAHRSRLENHVVDEEVLRINGQEIAREVTVYQVEACHIRRIDTIE